MHIGVMKMSIHVPAVLLGLRFESEQMENVGWSLLSEEIKIRD